MTIYKNILVAIDCSSVDEVVIEQVSALAGKLGSTVHLLHIVHSHTIDQERNMREQANVFMKNYQEILQNKGIEVNLIIRSGEPEKEILREIKENAYDLLAMATHGHNRIGRIIFGSVSRSLREKTPIPLLLIRSGQ
ncbi:MAG: universal stress protein [Chlorobiaceae bacterium]|jgi:nucleotide-binding universal stress UspA family protein|nr:universal stress protein [Chlorobiaceae bacterium]